MATGYNVDGSAAPLIDLGWVSPAGQMFSSARDLDIVCLHLHMHATSIMHKMCIIVRINCLNAVCKILYERQ